MKRIIIFYFSFVLYLSFTNNNLYAQKDYLQSGPMICYSDNREVLLWVQTKISADVKIDYWVKSLPNRKYSTNTVKTQKQQGFTAKLFADSVSEGKTYEYELFINNKKINFDYPHEFKTQKIWQWRTDPPDIKFAMGSCAYINDSLFDRPGKPYGGGYEVFESIYKYQPDFFLWLGDNLYFRDGDWNTLTGIFNRYTQTRSLPQMQPMLANCSNYAIWDDHDFGPNDADRGFWNKEMTLDAFKLFWGNPSYGINGGKGITTMFSWSDCDFFLLDNRYWRSPNLRKTGEREILGDEQIQWLIDNLVSSTATFKFIVMGGQFLNPYAKYEVYVQYAAERNKILKLIEEENIKGVIFLTGDRHFTELSEMPRVGTYPLLDFTVSPLCASPYSDADKEPNYYRVEGTAYVGRNFGAMEVSGKYGDRTIKIITYDTKGNKIWEKSYNQNQLR